MHNGNIFMINRLHLLKSYWHSSCTSRHMDALARQNIEVFARYLYEIEGCPQGRSQDFRMNAERQLKEILFKEDRPTPKAKSRKKKSP